VLLNALWPDEDEEEQHGQGDSRDGAYHQPDHHTGRDADPPELLKTPSTAHRSTRDCDEQAKELEQVQCSAVQRRR